MITEKYGPTIVVTLTHEQAEKIRRKCSTQWVKLSDINLSITEDVLTLSGKRNLEFQISTDDYLIQECFWGDFSRAIVLPDNIDQTRITASFKDGILKITIPKTSNKNKTKLIRIKSE
jgi:HSP20 family protein